MEFKEQRERAIAAMHRKGLRLASAEPPPVGLLRRCGFQIRPLLFESFFRVTLITGAWFALLWGCGMWLWRWRHDDANALALLVGCCAAGAIFGICHGALYAWLRKRHGLPTWEALADAAGR